jgi:WD40 repeat protein
VAEPSNAQSEQTVTLRVDGAIDAVAFSPDSKMAATVSGSWIVIWDVRTGRWLYRLRVPRGGVSSVVFLPDNRRIVAGGRDRRIRIWTIDTDVLEDEIPLKIEKDDGVLALALSTNGRLLAAATYAKRVHVVDMKTKATSAMLRLHKEAKTHLKNSLAFSPDGALLASASGGSEGTIVIWDVHRKVVAHTLTGDARSGMTRMAWSRDGEVLATAGTAAYITLWNTRTGDFIEQFLSTVGTVNGMAFSPTMDVLAIVGGHSVCFWDVNKKEFIARHSHRGVASLAFSTDGKLLITGSEAKDEGSAKIWHAPAK